MSDNKIIKTSRATEEHKEALRKKPWSPPSALDAPPAPVGMVHRWIRVESMGFQDTANVSKKLVYLLVVEESPNFVTITIPKTN
jgi:hypothetical protein